MICTNSRHETGIERPPGFGPNDVHRVVPVHRLVVRPVRRERIEVVDDREHARAERNGFAREAFGVARPVPPLVMALDERRHRIRERHRADDSAPIAGWMRTRSNSSGVSRPGFVRMCSGTASLPMSCSSAATFTPSISPSDMPASAASSAALACTRRMWLSFGQPFVDRLVACVDGACERFDARHVQLRDLLDVLLLLLDAPQVDPVAAIREIERRRDQQHRPDLHRHDDADGHHRDAGADEARRCGPEEVLLPRGEASSRRDSDTAVATSQLLQRKKVAAAPTAGRLSERGSRRCGIRRAPARPRPRPASSGPGPRY